MPNDSNETNPSGLSDKQERAISALLIEPTHKRAAAAAGVGESTLRRWLSEAPFRSAYFDARRNALEQSTARMQQLTSKATTLFESFMDDEKVPHSTRLNAAKFIVEKACAGLELEDQSNQLVELLKRLKEPANG